MRSTLPCAERIHAAPLSHSDIPGKQVSRSRIGLGACRDPHRQHSILRCPSSLDSQPVARPCFVSRPRSCRSRWACATQYHSPPPVCGHGSPVVSRLATERPILFTSTESPILAKGHGRYHAHRYDPVTMAMTDTGNTTVHTSRPLNPYPGFDPTRPEIPAGQIRDMQPGTRADQP